MALEVGRRDKREVYRYACSCGFTVLDERPERERICRACDTAVGRLLVYVLRR